MPSKISSTLLLRPTLNAAAEKIRNVGIDSAWLDAELLMAHVLKRDRVFVLAHGDYQFPNAQKKRFDNLVNLRAKHFPLAYLLGHKEFYGLDFLVTPDVLVPRPESELMVELALEEIAENSIVIDVGTGSGCIAISIAKHSAAPVFGLDISAKALTVARKNAKKNRTTIVFKKSDLLSKLPSLKKYSKIIITANLPYLTKMEITNEPSIKREPRLALDGGKDGLAPYRKLFKQLAAIKKSYGNEIVVLCEVNPHQKSGFQAMASTPPIFKKDLAGKIRLAIVRI